MIYRHKEYEWASDAEGLKKAKSVLHSDCQLYVSVSNEQSTTFNLPFSTNLDSTFTDNHFCH